MDHRNPEQISTVSHVSSLLSPSKLQHFLQKAVRQPLSPEASKARKETAGDDTSLKMALLFRNSVLQGHSHFSERYDLLLEQFDHDESKLLAAIQHLLPANVGLQLQQINTNTNTNINKNKYNATTFISTTTPTPTGETKRVENDSMVSSGGRASLRAQHPHALDLMLELQGSSSFSALDVLSQAVDQLSDSAQESSDRLTSDTIPSRRNLIEQGISPLIVDLYLEKQHGSAPAGMSTRTVRDVQPPLLQQTQQTGETKDRSMTSNEHDLQMLRSALIAHQLSKGLDLHVVDLLLESRHLQAFKQNQLYLPSDSS